MNILITGGTGFIGRHLVEELSKSKDNKIYCIVRNLDRAKILKPYNVELIYADITRWDTMEKIINYNIDVIFHCAGCVQNKNYSLLEKNNVLGTKNICELALSMEVNKLVYLSSVAVISGNDEIPLCEDLPHKATNIYGKSKIKAEQEVLGYREKGLKTVIIRPCMVYGEGEPHLTKTLLLLLKFRMLPLINEGHNKFHLVYVKNVVDLIIYSLSKEEFLKGTFFIADKEVLTTKEVFSIFSEAINTKPPRNIPKFLNPFVLNFPYVGCKIKSFYKDRVYSIERIKTLGFNHQYNAQHNLKKSAQYFFDKM